MALAATVGTGLTLAWLANELYRDVAFAAFAALIYLTLADVFFYRGWLAYVDPLFAFFVFAVFPYYQKQYRGENFETTARDILRRASGQPFDANNVSASGLSVTAHLDVLRLPAPPLTFPPRQWESGFVMAYAPDPRLGQVAVEYRLGGNTLYLLCRGAACATVTRNQ